MYNNMKVKILHRKRKVEYVTQINCFLVLDDLPCGKFKGECLYKSICVVCSRTRFRTAIYMICNEYCDSKKCKDLFDFRF